MFWDVFVRLGPYRNSVLTRIILKHNNHVVQYYSISQEICTRFLLCCALLWSYIDWFPIFIRLTSLALWQSNDCPSASKATLMNMDEYFMWIHYERLHNHNKAKHNKTVWIFLVIYYRCHIKISNCPISCKWMLSLSKRCVSELLTINGNTSILNIQLILLQIHKSLHQDTHGMHRESYITIIIVDIHTAISRWKPKTNSSMWKLSLETDALFLHTSDSGVKLSINVQMAQRNIYHWSLLICD